MPEKLTKKEALIANLIAKYTHNIKYDKKNFINEVKEILKIDI